MTELTEVSRAHKSKPDRSEPWRYVCPQCGRQVDGWNAAQGEYECENGHTGRMHWEAGKGIERFGAIADEVTLGL